MLFFTSFVTLQQITNKNQPSSVYSTITNVVNNLSQWSSISLTGLNNGFYKVYIRLVAEYFYIFTIKCKMIEKKRLGVCLKNTYCKRNKSFKLFEN